MRSAHESYQRHLRKLLSVKGYAVWPPGRVLGLGDIGILGDGGDFQKRTDLEELGIKATIKNGPRQPTMSATSQDVEQAEVRARGDMLTARGSLRLQLGAEGSVIFEVRDFQHVQIDNLDEIAGRVAELWKQDKWKRSWCLVDQVWRAGTGTIIVSTNGHTEVSITAGASDSPVTLATLADADAGVHVEVRGEGVVKAIGSRKLTPMVRLTLDEVETAWRGSSTED
jgi:hypothetical protein